MNYNHQHFRHRLFSLLSSVAIVVVLLSSHSSNTVMALNSYDINYDDGTMITNNNNNNNNNKEVLTSKQKVVVGKGNLRSSDKNNIRNLESEDGTTTLPGPWPECIRRSFWVCKEMIEEELAEISSEEQWEIQTIHENRPVTMDYRETRVRIFFNNFGRVVDAPMIG